MFQAILPIRPVSLQSKGSKKKYKTCIHKLIEQYGFAPTQPFSSGRLYARILWLHASGRDGDIDNIVKPLLDSFISIAYDDDKLIEICAVKTMPVSSFELSDRYLNAQLFDVFQMALLCPDNDHILYIEIDRFEDDFPFFGPIDGVQR